MLRMVRVVGLDVADYITKTPECGRVTVRSTGKYVELDGES